MAAYCTRAGTKPRGFYASLNCRSTADIYEETATRRITSSLPSSNLDSDDVYAVERLVASRPGKVCYRWQPPLSINVTDNIAGWD